MIKRGIHNEINRYLDSPDALIVTGMRRVGKTTLLQQIYDELSTKNKLFLDLEAPNDRKILEGDNYEEIKIRLMARNLDFSQRCFIFLDEIQLLKNLPSVAKYFLDHYGVKFLMTGSASFYLKNLFTESLAGRKFIFELFPLSFSEFLAFKMPNLKIPPQPVVFDSGLFELFAPHYEEYLAFGGFPGVVTRPTAEEKNKAIEDIFTSYFQNEVEKLGDFHHNEIVRDLILLLMERSGSRISVAKISSELGISSPTVSSYLAFLEQTYFIYLVRPYSQNRGVEIRKSPKIYFCDTGILNRFARLDEGKIFENAVYSALRSRGRVNYYQKKSGVEIDFILNKEEAFETKRTAGVHDIKRLRSLAGPLGISKISLVAKNFTSQKDAVFGFSL